MVILDYIKFKKFPLTVELSIYLIHGNPRNISNEIEHDILSFYKKCDYEHITYVVDDDADDDADATDVFAPNRRCRQRPVPPLVRGGTRLTRRWYLPASAEPPPRRCESTTPR